MAAKKMIGERVIQLIKRDIQVFRAVCEFMEDGGVPPKIRDLVGIVNRYENLPNREQRSVGNATISCSLHRLEEIGLISMGRIKAGSDRRSAGSIKIEKSEFKILIATDEARKAIENHHETSTTRRRHGLPMP